MDEDGSAEGGRTRLARGTKPNASMGEHEADGANADADAAVPAATAPRGGGDARVRSAILTAPARAGSLPAIPGTARRAARPSGAPEPGHAGPVPTDLDTTVGGPGSAGVERGEMGGGHTDGSAAGAGGGAPRGIERSETGGGAPRGIERSETSGGDPDGSAAGAGGGAPRGIDARGSGPVPAGGTPSGAGRASAQSICEAVEQLIEAQEADEAIAEWMQGGG